MKTSNKLLIALFLFLPLLLVGTDLLLKQQFVKGNLSKNVETWEKPVVTELKPFRHVVFDGRQLYRQGDREREKGTRLRLLLIAGQGHPKEHIEVHPKRKDMLKYTYRHDTLFIGFRLKSMDGEMLYGGHTLVTLVAPEVSSVTCITGNVSLSPFRQQLPLALHALQGSMVSVNNMELPFLRLNVEAGASVEMSDTRIDSLAYDMADGSRLEVSRPYNIGLLKPGRVDGNSFISVSGKGPDMEQLMAPQPGKEALTDVKQ